MQLFLSILSTIGFIVLIILAVILALIALILFFPIVYKAKIKKTEDFLADGSVKWLFGAFTLRFAFKNKSFDWSIKLFGFSLDKLLKKDKKDDSKKNEYTPAKKQPTIKPGEIVQDAKDETADKISEDKSLNAAVESIAEEKTKNDEEDDKKPDKGLIEKIRFTFSNICAKLKKIKDDFELFDKVKPTVMKLLKHILPKKIKGYISFGFPDPADTGVALGVLGALCIPIPKQLKIEPDFNEKRFECDVKLSGRLIVAVLIVYIIKLLKVPEIKEILGLGSKNKGKHRNTKRKNFHNKSKNKEAK